MTLYAADFSVYSFAVRNLRDVLVALHTRPIAVHATFEVFRRHMQLARVTIGQSSRQGFDPVTSEARCIGGNAVLSHRGTWEQVLQRG